MRAGKEGEGLESKRGPDERSSGRLSEEERKRGAGGEAAGREQRSRGGPAPRDSAAATLGPYHEVSPALGLRENKWCPR